MRRWRRCRVDAALSLDCVARLSSAAVGFSISPLAHRNLLADPGGLGRSKIVFPLPVGRAGLAAGLSVVDRSLRKALIRKTRNSLTPCGRRRKFPAKGRLRHVAL